jgi:hypothetical protein
MVFGLNIVTTTGHTTGSTLLDGDIDKVHVFDSTPDGGNIARRLGSGRPVKPEFLPTKIRWDEGLLELPDFERSRITTLSERAKTLIESFEPGIHQFFPIEYLNDIDGGFLARRYILNVCNRIDSLDHDRTTFVLRHVHTTTGFDIHYWALISDMVHNGETHLIPPPLSTDTKSKFVFSLKKIGNAHLWVDKYMLGKNGPWMSQALMDALKRSGFTGLDLYSNGLESV